MSVTRDIKAAKKRFASYILRFRNLLAEYRVCGKEWYRNLKLANADPEFIARRDQIWKEILEQEGGKLTLGTVLAIVGAALGGAGIAVGGGAFGLPLVLLLAPIGVWVGNEVDEEGLTRRFLKELQTHFNKPGAIATEIGIGLMTATAKLNKWADALKQQSPNVGGTNKSHPQRRSSTDDVVDYEDISGGDYIRDCAKEWGMSEEEVENQLGFDRD
jgi:hypothetical protein